MAFPQSRISNMNVHYFRYPFRFFAEEQQRRGISSAVLWGSTPHLWIDHLELEDPRPLKRELTQAGIRLAAFGAKPYGYSLYESEGSQRGAAAMAYYRNCIEAARLLECKLLCIEAEGALRDADPDDSWNCFRSNLAQLCREASAAGIRIALGTSSPDESCLLTTLSQLVRMLREVDADNLRALLNTGAAAASGDPIPQWFESLGSDIAMVYLTDGRERGDYAWGDGCFSCGDFLDALTRAGYRGPVALKMNRDRYELDPVGTDEKNISRLFCGETGYGMD